MRILTKQEMIKMPVGTVFAKYVPNVIRGSIMVKTDCNENGWNGAMILEPFGMVKDEKDEKLLHTNWSIFDDSDADYGERQLFVVFSKSEIQQMINCLTWALSGCQSYFDDKHYYGDDNVPPIHEDNFEE